MHKLFFPFILAAAVLMLTSCADQFPAVQSSNNVPADKSAYIGEWQSESITLVINKDGNVTYNQKKGVVNSSISGPIKNFTGNNFEIGMGPLAKTFIVSAAPHKEDNAWKMTVDGNELTRK